MILNSLVYSVLNKNQVKTMSIQAIGLKNFTVFEDLRLEVSSGINIFIGENGTGKTHLLKAIYAACEISKGGSSRVELLKKCFKKKVSLELFRNTQRRELDIYLKANCKNKEIIVCESSFPVVIIVRNGKLDEDNKFSEDKPESKEESYQIHLQEDVIFDATFIPCKDMLTHADGDEYIDNFFGKACLASEDEHTCLSVREFFHNKNPYFYNALERFERHS